jgi:hypothetical protein
MLGKEYLEVLIALYLLCKGNPGNSIRDLRNIANLTSIDDNEVLKSLGRLKQKGLVEFLAHTGYGGIVDDIALIKLTGNGFDYVENPFKTKGETYGQINIQTIKDIVITGSPGGNVDAKNISKQNIINLSPEQISETNEGIDSIKDMIEKSGEIPDGSKRELLQILDKSKEMLMEKDNSGFMNKLKEFWSKILKFITESGKIINLLPILEKVISFINKVIILLVK